LDRSRIIAPPGFSRWLVPPAALAIHLAIGEAYAFSVFKLPLTKLLGGDPSANWTQPQIAWVFSIAIVLLGLSAAIFGRWLERVGPRKAMFASAVCFAGGFLISALGVVWHQLILLYFGYGVIGGIGLGLGYISPVSTLIKWFPDRPGMATGMAIMGFGGGAMIGSPLSDQLMNLYRTESSQGVAETFVTLALIYFLFMMFGVWTVRLPPAGWRPAGWTPSRRTAEPGGMTAAEAILTVPFWLLWAVLFLNVTAGIGILEQASPMIREMFPDRVTAAAAAGFVGLLSLFNMGGRFAWSSLSDVIGRKPTYAIFFLLGAALYALVPQVGRAGHLALFVLGTGIILTMYGGGFATIPAYLRDQFGTVEVGAIHGRLLTAWSLAGIAGPVLVNYIREYQLEHGADPYSVVLYLMACLLGIGFVCNLLIPRRPVRAVGGTEKGPAGGPPPDAVTPAVGRPDATPEATTAPAATLLFSWLWVTIPLAWGVWQTAVKSLALFR
jgi:MFS family permease